jgi:hypothetical protein
MLNIGMKKQLKELETSIFRFNVVRALVIVVINSKFVPK